MKLITKSVAMAVYSYLWFDKWLFPLYELINWYEEFNKIVHKDICAMMLVSILTPLRQSWETQVQATSRSHSRQHDKHWKAIDDGQSKINIGGAHNPAINSTTCCGFVKDVK